MFTFKNKLVTSGNISTATLASLYQAHSSSISSLMTGKAFMPVDKVVVASEDSSTADAIATLRSQLASGDTTFVNQDGTIFNPADSMSTSSVSSGEGFKPVDKAVVASEDSSTADAIATLRSQLASGDTTFVNQDGTIFNPADSMSTSSVSSGEGFKPVDKAVVATEWYQTNPLLKKEEIKEMKRIHPEARQEYLPNGKMYWAIRLRPVVCGKRKDWTILAIYDSDHPQQRWGGSVKFYPVSPNYSEMQQMVQQSSVYPKSIPHLLRDSDNQIYMCTQHKDNIYAGRKKGERLTTAAACLRYAMRWITVFELGLIDQQTWSLFQEHGKI